MTLHPSSPPLGFDPDRASTSQRRSVIDSGAAGLREVTRWLISDPLTEGLPVGYFGTDGGAAVALIVAADATEVVGAVVSVGGRPDFAGNALRWVSAPTLLIVAEHDTEVLAANEIALDQLDGEKELEVLPEVRHHAEDAAAFEYMVALAADWFEAHLLELAGR